MTDSKRVAAALERLYQNPDVLQERSLAAYQRATHPRYSWDTVAESFDEILSELAQQHRTQTQPVPHLQTTVTGGI
jgi:glycosyltransferase involved in cell wall biosynthesis